ncbi:MAG TPA: sporulation membrane protein YtrI [Cerasibacillus sp.]|uniref:sporulation membrane protein YtrI n=1 Tax=Cerasibacillus sp. TaxID=2498711 RepID=UPI002F3F8E88
MHIPPYFKRKAWQYVFVGMIVGGVIAYLVFIYMYGEMYEQLLEKNIALESELRDVKKQNQALLEINEDLEKPAIIETIKIDITNPKELKLDSLLVHQLVGLIKEELDSLIGKPIQQLSDSGDLLIATIENKRFKLNDLQYRFEVVKLIISKEVKVEVEAFLVK